MDLSALRVPIIATTAGLDTGLAAAKFKIKDFSASAATGLAGAEGAASKLALEETAIGAAMVRTGELAEERILGMREQFIGLGAAMIGPLAALGTLEGAFEAFKGELEREVDAGKLAASLGLSVESLTQLEHAADMTEVPIDTLSTGLRQLADNALKMAQGQTQGAALAFKTLGLSVTTASGQIKPTNDLFTEVAAKFEAMPDSATKTALAMQLFGRSGAELIPLLDKGKEGLAEFAKEADALGITISGKSAAAADALDEKIKRLDDTFQGIVATVVQDTIPAIDGAVDAISELLGSAGESNVIVDLVEGGIRDISSFVVQLTGAAKQAYDVFEGLNVLWYEIQNGKIATWPVEAWFNAAARDGAAADKKAKAILDGTYVPTGEPGAAKGTGTGTALTPTLATTAKTSPYASALESAKQATAALVAQQAALGQTGYQAAYLEEQQKLLNAATKKGTDLSGPQIAAIDAAAAAYAQQKSTLEVLTAAYDEGKQATEDFFSTFKSDLMNGTSLWGAFGDAASKALDDIANKALQMAADGIWNLIWGSAASGSSSGSGLGGIISGALSNLFHFAGGTDDAPGGLSWVGEEGPELMNVPRHAQVYTAPQSRQIASGAGSAAPVTLAPVYNFIGSGFTEAQAKRLMNDNNRQLIAALPAAAANARRRAVPGFALMAVSMPAYAFTAISVLPDMGITSSQAESGLIVTSRNGDPNWAGTLTTDILEADGPDQLGDFLAFLSRCVDLNLRVDFVHPRHQYPDGYDAGTWPLDDTPTVASFTDLRNLVVAGLATGMVLLRGTRLSLVQGSGDSEVISHRWLAADVTVTSELSQAIEITPRLPIGVFAEDCQIIFVDPVMRLMIVPGSWSAAEKSGPSTVSFGVAESLR